MFYNSLKPFKPIKLTLAITVCYNIYYQSEGEEEEELEEEEEERCIDL